jgi:hypothetical protein
MLHTDSHGKTFHKHARYPGLRSTFSIKFSFINYLNSNILLTIAAGAAGYGHGEPAQTSLTESLSDQNNAFLAASAA